MAAVWPLRILHTIAGIVSKESDSILIEGLKRRDPNAMADLYDRHVRLIYSLAFYLVRNKSEAEEIVQETFLRAWTRAHLINDSAGTIRPWLLAIARNLAIDSLRKSHGRSLQHTTYELFAAPAVSDPQVFYADQAQILRRAFAHLPDEQRTVLRLAYFEGMSQTEIATRMRKPLGTIKTWKRMALNTLRECLRT